MTKAELDKCVNRLRFENGELARELATANRARDTSLATLDAYRSNTKKKIEENRIQVEKLWEDVKRARAERDQEQNKCKKCGIHLRIEDMQLTIDTQRDSLERWTKLEKLMNDAGWVLEIC